MGTSSNKDKGAVIDRFTKEAVVISAPSKVKGGPELQLPSMNALTNKTSSQAFFLRVLKVIIQLRDAALHAMKKASTKAAAAAAAAAKTESPPAPPAAGAEDETTPKEAKDEPSSPVEQMEVEEPSLPSLSDQLTLEILWDTLSCCLRDLADTPDHHAVLVLQATVEAFFLVHAAPTAPEDKKKVQQKETR
jgi:E3 ubiquitin-protein ligase HUWE1